MARSKRRKLHPLIDAAGERGELPSWAKLGKTRRAHVERVAELMDAWAVERGYGSRDRVRWRAAGRLHDALKEAKPARLEEWLGENDWPAALIHGPACAARLRAEGVRDDSLLAAITHHSTGHPDLDELGRMLYLADYLEPGRRTAPQRRARLRARMPRKQEDVLRDVAAYRIKALLNKRLPIRPATLEFWNGLASGG